MMNGKNDGSKIERMLAFGGMLREFPKEIKGNTITIEIPKGSIKYIEIGGELRRLKTSFNNLLQNERILRRPDTDEEKKRFMVGKTKEILLPKLKSWAEEDYKIFQKLLKENPDLSSILLPYENLISGIYEKICLLYENSM